jgi:hypothetical protein
VRSWSRREDLNLRRTAASDYRQYALVNVW